MRGRTHDAPCGKRVGVATPGQGVRPLRKTVLLLPLGGNAVAAAPRRGHTEVKSTAVGVSHAERALPPTPGDLVPQHRERGGTCCVPLSLPYESLDL